MLITRKSELTGIVRTLDIPVTEGELKFWEKTNQRIQDVMPHLTDDEREFILSGITEDEWDYYMAETYEPREPDDETDSDN